MGLENQLAAEVRDTFGQPGVEPEAAEPRLEVVRAVDGSSVPRGPLEVLRRVAADCGVTVSSFRKKDNGKKGTRWQIVCRMLAAAEMRARCTFLGRAITLDEIGAYLTESGKPLDHSTVHYYLNTLESLKRKDANRRKRKAKGLKHVKGGKSA